MASIPLQESIPRAQKRFGSVAPFQDTAVVITRLLCLLLLAPAAAAAAPADDHFRQKVKPLLDSRCISCHGAEKQKGGLRLDSRAATLKGGENGPAMIPGKPGQSLLLQAVLHSKPDL